MHWKLTARNKSSVEYNYDRRSLNCKIMQVSDENKSSKLKAET